MDIVNLTPPARNPRKCAYPDIEQQKRALDEKAHRVSLSLKEAAPSRKSTRALQTVQLILGKREGQEQLRALLANLGLKLQHIKEEAATPTPVQA